MKGAGQIQDERFIAEWPRPKLRSSRTHKPNQAPAAPVVLHVLEDVENGKALIRGRGVAIALDMADLRGMALWSPGAKGFVVTSDQLADVMAAAAYLNAPTTYKRLGEAS